MHARAASSSSWSRTSAALMFGLGALGALGALASAVTGCDPLGRLPPSTAAREALTPPNKPIDECERACKERARHQCSESECSRGCEFILDRLVEKETDNVIACVARSARRCTDVVWADCGARIGVHADGGPPPPPPPVEED